MAIVQQHVTNKISSKWLLHISCKDISCFEKQQKCSFIANDSNDVSCMPTKDEELSLSPSRLRYVVAHLRQRLIELSSRRNDETLLKMVRKECCLRVRFFCHHHHQLSYPSTNIIGFLLSHTCESHHAIDSIGQCCRM